MSEHELAAFLVHSEEVPDVDYDYDERPYTIWHTIWIAPDGQQFFESEYEAAINHTLGWLESEVIS